MLVTGGCWEPEPAAGLLKRPLDVVSFAAVGCDRPHFLAKTDAVLPEKQDPRSGGHAVVTSTAVGNAVRGSCVGGAAEAQRPRRHHDRSGPRPRSVNLDTLLPIACSRRGCPHHTPT